MRPLTLPLVRLTRGGTGMGAVAIVVAVASAGIAVTGACQVGLQQAAMRQTIGGLAPAERSVSVSYDGATSDLPRAAAQAARALSDLGASGAPSTAVASRTMWDGRRTTVQIAAADDVQSAIALSVGRLPRTCVPTQCEVVQVGPGEPDVAGFGLVIVGHGTITGSSPLNQLLDPGATALVSANTDRVRAIEQVAAIGSSTVWSAPLSSDTIAALSLEWLDRVQRVAASLTLTDGRLVVHVPDSEIRRAVNESTVAAGRIVGLSLALALLAIGATWLTVGQRRDDVQAVGLLARQFGRSDLQHIGQVTVAVAIIAGASISAAIMQCAFSGGLLPHPTPHAWSAIAATAIGCIAVSIARLSRRSLLSTAAWVATAIVVIATFDARPVAWSVPLGAVAGAGLALASRSVSTIGWRRSMTRVHAANMAAPLAAAIAIAAGACGALCAATTQDAALAANARDQAMFSSPLAERLTSLARSPLSDATVADYAAATGDSAYPVLRVPATARSGSLQAATVQLVGVPADAWRRMADMRRQTGVGSEVFDAVAGLPLGDIGRPLVPESTLAVAASGLDTHSDLLLWVYDGNGRALSLACAWASLTTCRAAVPSGWQHVSLIGIGVQEQPAARARREHAAGEGSHAVQAPRGTVVINTIRSAGLSALSGTGGLRITYDLAEGPSYTPLVRAPANIPALTDADTAAGSPAVLSLEPGVSIAIEPVATAHRLPTAPSRFAAVDFNVLAATLAATDPSLLVANEIWLASPLPAASPLRTGLTSTRQADVLAALDGSAARRWTRGATLAAAMAMLIMAVLAAAALARTVTERLPFHSWQLLGTARRAYLRGGIAVGVRQGLLVSSAASVAAAYVANTTVHLVATDIVGRTAAPPIAYAWAGWLVPVSAATSTLAFIATFTAAIAKRTPRERS